MSWDYPPEFVLAREICENLKYVKHGLKNVIVATQEASEQGLKGLEQLQRGRGQIASAFDRYCKCVQTSAVRPNGSRDT